MEPRIITIIGSLNTDLVTTTARVPSGGETLTGTSFSTGPGGKGANQAVACARLSQPKPKSSIQTPGKDSDILVRMCGAVGDDEFGPLLLKGMEANGINVDEVKVVNGHTTGVAVIIVEESTGENRILLNPGANHSLQPQDFMSPSSLGAPLPDLIILQLEISFETVLQLLRTAKEHNVPVLLNPAPAVKLPDEVFEGLTHLIVNESEAAILSNRSVSEVEALNFPFSTITAEFLSKGVQNVVITLGSKGAFFASTSTGAEGIFVSADKVEKVVDTTAAGDTFVGAYAVAVVRNGGKVGEDDVKFACKAAGRTVEKKGAQSAIPWVDEVERSA